MFEIGVDIGGTNIKYGLVNEALEIAKNYEAQEVVSFMNGVLGTFVRTEFPDTPAKPEKKADEAEG